MSIKTFASLNCKRNWWWDLFSAPFLKSVFSSLFKNMRSLRLTVFQLFTRKVISTKAILIFVFIYIMCSGNQVRNMEKDMIYYIQKYKSENLNYDKD